MKTYLLFFFSLLMLTQSQAQNFAPVGAKWHYTRGKANNLNTMEVIADTLINNLVFKKVKVISYQDYTTKRLECIEYLWGNNDSILYYNYYHNQMFKLYDFSKDSGDILVVHEGKFKPTDAFQIGLWNIDSIDGLSYVIGKTDSVLINQKFERRQVIKQLGSNNNDWRFNTRNLTYAISKIGSTGYFWGSFVGASVAESDDILRCYNDSSTSYRNPNYPNDCNYITGLINVAHIHTIQISPNPFTSYIRIEKNADYKQASTYKISNALGQIIIIGAMDNNSILMNTNNWHPGVYFLTITNKDNITTETIKLLKHHE